MSYVTFEYADGRLPAGRTITMAPAKVHEIAANHDVTVINGWGSYAAFCESNGHEPLAAEAIQGEEGAAPDPVADDPIPAEPEVPEDDDGWPDGYDFRQKGSWFTVLTPAGEEVGKAQGEEAAREMAHGHAGR